MKNKIFYKALDSNMIAVNGNKMQYNLNVTYHLDANEDLEMCKSGFHYCDNIKDAMKQYHFIPNFRVFEIEPSGNIICFDNNHLYCASSIILVKEISKDEILKYIEDNDLVHDSGWYIRSAVASQGYRLDILINDKNPVVRTVVAKQGYGLDILIHDKDEVVRKFAELEIKERKDK